MVRDKQAQLNSQSLLFNFWVSHWFTTRRLSTNNPASYLIRKLDTMSSAEAFKIFHHKAIVLSKHFIKNLAMNTELENYHHFHYYTTFLFKTLLSILQYASVNHTLYGKCVMLPQLN